MARNDILLLNSLLKKAPPQFGAHLDNSELFELFVFESILRDYDLSLEELEEGWTDGASDGGIDGAFLFLDDTVLTEWPPSAKPKRTPELRLAIFTVKQEETFKEAPLNTLLSSLPELLDLSREELNYPYSESLLEARALFRDAYIALADQHPTVSISVFYASKGDTSTLSEHAQGRANALQAELNRLFSNTSCQVQLLGASELVEIARKRKVYSLRLKFVETNLSRGGPNYIILSKLTDYHKFVTDEEGNLRRYLFDSNVRDYVGDTGINSEIEVALTSTSDGCDFWWLNNGITILASKATIAGKELALENVQIVNGLQTTRIIWKHFAQTPEAVDERAVLVKVIISNNDEIRDRIIKATNSQNAVDLASLRATDKIQRNIEHYLEERGWFYERRKHFYRNQGRPAEKVVSMTYLGAAIWALVYRQPSSTKIRRAKWMRNEHDYRRVFKDEFPLKAYAVCLEIAKSMEKQLPSIRHAGVGQEESRKKRFPVMIASLLYVCRSIGKWDYSMGELLALDGKMPTSADGESAWQWIVAAAQDFRKTEDGAQIPTRRIQFSRTFLSHCQNRMEKEFQLASRNPTT